MILAKAQQSDRLDQGLIVQGLPNPSFPSMKLSVVLNPTCQFANSKADSVVVAYLVPARFIVENSQQWQTFVNSLSGSARLGTESISKGKLDSVEKILGVLIDNDEPRRHYFVGALPETDLVNSFVDFQQIASFPYTTARVEARAIARVVSPFREQLATNYAGYMMRIGVERYAGDARRGILSSLATPLSLPQK